LTALPVIETKAGDISAYIPTNVISITDGQIYLQDDLFKSGVRPAFDTGLSVSRVGGNAQVKAMKTAVGTLKGDLSQFRELESFAAFGSELDKVSQAQLDRGYRLVELLKQPLNSPMPVEEQVVSLYAATNGYLDPVPVSEVRRFERELLEWLRSRHGDILDAIRTGGDVPDVEALDAAIKDFAEQFSWELAGEEAGGPGTAASATTEQEQRPAVGTDSEDDAGEATESAEEEGHR
jgi:F-type H+/Na+-transporting ATPase subunit alpha